MSPPIFDAIAALRRLEDSGIPRAQAEAMVQCHQETINASRGDLATKADVAELRAEMAEHHAATTADVAELRAEMAEHHAATTADMAKLEAKFGQLEGKFGQLEGKLYKALYIQTGAIIGSVVGALAIYRFLFLGV